MVTEHLDDGEGELLARVRKVVGPRVPVVASLDLHANMTRAMIEHARRPQRLLHVSAHRHGARPARAPRRLLDRTIDAGAAAGQGDASARLPDRPAVAVHVHRTRQEPVRIAGASSNASTTRRCRSRRAFRWRIFPSAGWRCSATARTPRSVKRAVDALAHAVHDAEPEFAHGTVRAGRRGRARDAARRARRAGRAGGHAGQSGRRRQRRHHGAPRARCSNATRATRCWAC